MRAFTPFPIPQHRAGQDDKAVATDRPKSPLTPDQSASKRLPYDTCPGGGMVDALASGASGRKAVEVRVLSWAPPPIEIIDFS